MHRLYVLSIMISFDGNFTASCKDPDKILKECKDALLPDLIAQLKQFLHYYNPTNVAGHIKAEQLQQSRTWGNCASVSNKIPKVESTMRKE